MYNFTLRMENGLVCICSLCSSDVMVGDILACVARGPFVGRPSQLQCVILGGNILLNLSFSS